MSGDGFRSVSRNGGSGLLALLTAVFSWAGESVHTVPYVPSASTAGHAGVVRIESRSEVPGEVRVVAVDDAGWRIEAGELSLDARSAVEFDMTALEAGDATLGLTGTGPGEGDWRLELTTELDIEARAYARTDGFLTALHDAALVSGGEVDLPFFNPGSETDRRSLLRLTNAGDIPATLTVRGIDDAGESGGVVTVELGASEAASYAAAELESGLAASLTGALGDGEGRWRLRISAATGSAYATNLLLDGSGVLASVPGGISRGVLHRVFPFPSASDGAGRRGLVRVLNRSSETAEVAIEAFDETDRAYDRLALTLAAGAAGQFGSSDLEQGNAERGLSGSTGSGEGDWWLELSTASEIEVLSYVDTATGPQSALRGSRGSETDAGMRYEALLWRESGGLRLLNAGVDPVHVRVTATDDAGVFGGGVELTLEPWTARRLTVSALEEGGNDLTGALGARTGSWRMVLDTDGELEVLSLVQGPSGMLSDVSRRGPPVGAPPRTEVIDASVRARPDLWVSATVTESELSPGEVFSLRAVVSNGGSSVSEPTMVRYYRSPDAAITPSDTEMGTEALVALASGAARRGSLSMNAPQEPGTYFYGACVDSVASETRTANNCSAGAPVTVAAPDRSPDLVVGSPSVSDAQPIAGASFVISATVRNIGGADASATTLRYYRSTDAAITVSDVRMGTDEIGALAASRASAESIRLKAPMTAGTYYFGACVDEVADEASTANNCSVAVEVTVMARRPNLTVPSFSVSDSGPVPGAVFAVSATVSNAGDSDAAATTVRYYRSPDQTITASDMEVGRQRVPGLAPGAARSGTLSRNAPEDSGTYYYGACVDSVPDEADTTDNCSRSARVEVLEPPAPDLEVWTLTADDTSPETGQTITLSATVANTGDGRSSATTLRYYSSRHGTITTSDTQVGTDAVEGLAASGTSEQSVDLTAPSTSGTYYYWACVDALSDESNTDNNCSPLATEVTVSEPPRPSYDLAVRSVVLDTEDPRAGSDITFSVTIGNIGDLVSTERTVKYYRWRGTGNVCHFPHPTVAIEVGSDQIDALPAGSEREYAVTLTAPDYVRRFKFSANLERDPGDANSGNDCNFINIAVSD